MRINLECIRSILLEVEENTSYKKDFILDHTCTPPGRLAPYLFDEIAGHMEQCRDRGMFTGFIEDITGCIYIKGLSEKGDSYLDTIRDDDRWNDIKKKIFSATSSPQMNLICSVISSFASNLLGGS